MRVLPTEPLNTSVFLLIDTPYVILTEHLTPRGQISIIVQPRGYLYEIPPITFVKSFNDLKYPLLMG